MTDKPYSLDEIQDMLDDLPPTPWHYEAVRDDGIARTGALRADDGRNVVEPSTESMSMVIGLTPSTEFLAAAPTIVQQLLDTINTNDAQVVAPEKPAKKDETAKND